MDISESIKAVASRQHTPLNKVAEKLGITRAALWSRLKDPKFSTLEAVAEALNVPVSTFFTENDFETGKLTCPYCGKTIKVFTA